MDKVLCQPLLFSKFNYEAPVSTISIFSRESLIFAGLFSRTNRSKIGGYDLVQKIQIF